MGARPADAHRVRDLLLGIPTVSRGYHRIVTQAFEAVDPRVRLAFELDVVAVSSGEMIKSAIRHHPTIPSAKPCKGG